ncbi:MAG: helix-turn-helix domain-containing protein [Polyangiaceae bacterium]
MNSSTRPPAVVVVTLSIDELRALVRDVVREALTQQAPAASAAPLVDRHELARLLGVSAATIARMTAEGMPHVFAGAAPRYAADEVRTWLAERGRKGTKAASRSAPSSVAGVRLLSRRGQ